MFFIDLGFSVLKKLGRCILFYLYVLNVIYFICNKNFKEKILGVIMYFVYIGSYWERWDGKKDLLGMCCVWDEGWRGGNYIKKILDRVVKLILYFFCGE